MATLIALFFLISTTSPLLYKNRLFFFTYQAELVLIYELLFGQNFSRMFLIHLFLYGGVYCMWRSIFESIGAAQLRSVEKSHRNHRSYVWTESLSSCFVIFFLSCATAIQCSVNIALVIKLSSENFQTSDVRSNVQPVPRIIAGQVWIHLISLTTHLQIMVTWLCYLVATQWVFRPT